MPSVGRSQHYKNSTAVTKRSRFRSATERAAHRLRGGFAGRRIEGSFRAGSLNISKRFRIAHVTGQENKVRWYRETFALLHTYAEGRFFRPVNHEEIKGDTPMAKELAKTYDPQSIESRLYQKWLDKKYFAAHVDRSKKPFTIVMPPPNITGQPAYGTRTRQHPAGYSYPLEAYAGL